MPSQTIKTRTRFFVAVEGESEQSFVKWLQMLSQKELHIHLDAVPLGGGGFKSMLKNAVRQHERRCKSSGAYQAGFLIVDSDRSEQGDWPIEQLKCEAAKHRITVCVQNPNHEGLLFRMMPGMEREIPDAASAGKKLKNRWPGYQKPMNAHALV
jgi:glycine cleavage system protein P-like pyridoxal-binding family